MSQHTAPEPSTQPIAAQDRTPGRGGIGSAAAVVIAAIVGLVITVALLALTGDAQGATGVAVLAILIGLGLVIGFRKQWTR